MPVSYCISEKHRVVMIRGTGQLTGRDFIEVNHAFLTHPQRARGFAEVWDTLAIDELVMEPDVINAYRDILQRYADRLGGERIAIIAKRRLVETLAAMFMAISSKRVGQIYEVFQDLETAEPWLELPRGTLSAMVDNCDWTEIDRKA